MTIEHYNSMIVQDAQRYIGEHVEPSAIELLAEQPSFAGVLDDGTVVGIVGMYDLGSGRHGVWALLGSDVGTHMLQVHKAVLRFLKLQDHRRIEATVDCSFAAGHRWVKMLGFVCEAECMKSYDPDGRDHALYARIL